MISETKHILGANFGDYLAIGFLSLCAFNLMVALLLKNR